MATAISEVMRLAATPVAVRAPIVARRAAQLVQDERTLAAQDARVRKLMPRATRRAESECRRLGVPLNDGAVMNALGRLYHRE